MSIKNLFYLDLSYNRIKSIKPFENLHFPKMKNLRIAHNLIDFNLQKNIDILHNISTNHSQRLFYFCYDDTIILI